MAKKISDDHIFYGFKLNEEQKDYRDAIYSDDYDIIFNNSPSGTGKTIHAVATAKLLVSEGRYNGLVYIFSTVEEEKCGYRPGDQTTKERNYLDPLIGALITIGETPEKAIKQMSQDLLTSKKKSDSKSDPWIDALSHTFMRGTNIDNKVVIIDEAQNFTLDELKKVLTRIHDNCVVIVIGHDGQCDLTNKDASGFVRYIEHFKPMARCKVCTLTENFRGWISNHADNLY